MKKCDEGAHLVAGTVQPHLAKSHMVSMCQMTAVGLHVGGHLQSAAAHVLH